MEERTRRAEEMFVELETFLSRSDEDCDEFGFAGC